MSIYLAIENLYYKEKENKKMSKNSRIWLRGKIPFHLLIITYSISLIFELPNKNYAAIAEVKSSVISQLDKEAKQAKTKQLTEQQQQLRYQQQELKQRQQQIRFQQQQQWNQQQQKRENQQRFQQQEQRNIRRQDQERIQRQNDFRRLQQERIRQRQRLILQRKT